MDITCPNDICTTAAPIFLLILILSIIVVSTIVAIVKAVLYCMIFSKAGYHWALGLLTLVPIACVIMPFVLAFGKWPIKTELEKLRARTKNATT